MGCNKAVVLPLCGLKERESAREGWRRMQPCVGEASEEIADERRRKGQGGPTLFLRGLGLPDAPRMEVWTYICAGPWVDDILVSALVQATPGPALSLSDPLPANCVPSIITTDALRDGLLSTAPAREPGRGSCPPVMPEMP